MRLLFLGAPGAGKGTQCQRLAEKLNLPHLSSGDILRGAVETGTPAGIEAKPYMDRGVFVPDNVLVNMFKERLSTPACAKGFILDGFPRNPAQAKALDYMLAEIKAPLTAVINLNVDERLLSDRITGRRTCSNKACAAVYHITFSPSEKDNICDKCGSPLSQRSDDKEDLVKKRLDTYKEQTQPLIEYYDAKHLLKTVAGEGNPDDIFAAILHTLKVTCG